MDPERRRDLVTWMTEYMGKNDMHAKDVAKRLGQTSNSFVSQMLRRDKKIPTKMAERWARAFRLSDDADIAHFRLLVDLMWSAESIRRLYWEGRDRLAAMENQKQSHVVQVSALEARVEALEAQLSLEKERAAVKRRPG